MSRSRRLVLSGPVGVAFALIVAGTALGVTWNQRFPVGDFVGGLSRMGANSAVSTEYGPNGTSYSVGVWRSTNGGTTWTDGLTLSGDGINPAISALDPYVDVVWLENDQVRYARSVNSGISYLPSVAVSPKSYSAINESVAHGPNGLVVIAWQNDTTNAVKVVVSTDYGAHFGAIKSFPVSVQDVNTAVAVGSGVVYLAYPSNYQNLMVTRSTNGGVSWSSPVTVTTQLTNSLANEFSLSAAADHVYIAYSDVNPTYPNWGIVRYRRSIDSGATWSAPAPISPASYKAFHPSIDLYKGVLRAVYVRKNGPSFWIEFQKSTDGVNWSAPQIVDARGIEPFVTDAGHVIVLFEDNGQSYIRSST